MGAYGSREPAPAKFLTALLRRCDAMRTDHRHHSAPWWPPRGSRRGLAGAASRPPAPPDTCQAAMGACGEGSRPRAGARVAWATGPAAVLLGLLAAAIFLAMTVGLMLGPLLVALATAFHTSVAVTGQLTAATALTWGLTALLAGPVSDTYGRRRLLLTGLLLLMLGTLGAAGAWTYGALVACRCLTGVGAALIAPNCLATVADVFPPAQRGQAMGWLVSASGLATAVGLPLVALLAERGGWRLPFVVLGGLVGIVGGLVWVWFPTHTRPPSAAVSLGTHVWTVGGTAAVWWVLAANGLQVMAFMGMSSYLAPYLMRTYQLSAGDTALPLLVAGLGVIAGGWLGGRVAGQAYRVDAVAGAFVGGGLGAVLVFTTALSPWATVGVAFSVASLLLLSWPVTAALLTEHAGPSCATATSLLTVSNQVGAVGGATLGGGLLALGSFPLVSLLCLGAATAAAVVLHAKVPQAATGHRPLGPS
jgi:predicted MFS family arabinose efflux permease